MFNMFIHAAAQAAAAAGPGCVLTLTGAVVSGFGLTPYETISGASVATSATGQRAATSVLTPVDWTGARCFEIVIGTDAGTTDGNVGISDLAGGNNARFFYNQWAPGDVLGFVLNDDGTSSIFKNGSPQGAGDTFPGDVYILLTTTGAAFSATVIPDKASMSYFGSYGAADWCGNT
jgi:hypothetical protein